MHTWLGHIVVHQKLTEHCKSTTTNKINKKQNTYSKYWS